MNLRKRVIGKVMPLGVALLVALGWAPLTAEAGSPPYLAGIGIHPTNPDVMVLGSARYFGGLVFTRDGGETWQMRCPPREAPGQNVLAFQWGDHNVVPANIVVTSDGKVVLPGAGLVIGDDTGCGFQVHNDLASVTAVALNPLDPSVVFFMTPDGLMRRDVDGSLDKLGTAPTDQSNPVYANNLTVAPRMQGGLRFYIGSVTTGSVAGAKYALRYSDDEGQSWQIMEISGMAPTDTPRVVYSDPSDSNRLAVALSRAATEDDAGMDVLLLSDDGGQSFYELLPGELAEVRSVVQTPDGAVWIADAGDTSQGVSGGLWRAEGWGTSPCKVGDLRMYGLAYNDQKGELWAVNHFELGVIDMVTGTFTKQFAIDEVDSIPECPDEDVVGWCQQYYCWGGAEGWCAAGHWPFTPACDAFLYLGEDTCVGYGRKRDSEIMLVLETTEWCSETPSSLACADFDTAACVPFGSSGNPDAGGGPPAGGDAGALSGGDAAGISGADASLGGTVGSDAGIGPDSSAGTGGATSGASHPPTTIDDGCECSFPTADRTGLGRGFWSLLGIGALLWRQRRRRSIRPVRR